MKKRKDRSKSSLENMEEALFLLLEFSFWGLLVILFSDTISTIQ